MRKAGLSILIASSCAAQFRTNVPLVLAPTAVTDGHGNYADGLAVDDLILYDNNVPQKIRMDWTDYPISLVVAVQASAGSGPVLDKLGGSGILFTQLLAAAGGETAVVSFSDQVTQRQEFTADPDKVTHAVRMLRKEGDGAHSLDALRASILMLEGRAPQRRRIVLMIAEKRDRGSAAKLADLVEQIERSNTTVYWLTFSPFVQPFTEKRKRMEDLKPEAERIKGVPCALCDRPDDRAAPLDLGPGGLMYALAELARMRHPDISELFTKTTGGRAVGFVRKNGLEETIHRIAAEVHRQYILSFPGNHDDEGEFHALRVEVRGRPELRVRTRAGYWALP